MAIRISDNPREAYLALMIKLAALMQPIQGEYARFFGQSSSPSKPILAQSRPRSGPPSAAADPMHPPASADGGGSIVSPRRPRPTADGPILGQQRADREGDLGHLPSTAMHFEGCLGDVLCVHVDLVSILPKALPLQQVTLVIAVMQVSTRLDLPTDCLAARQFSSQMQGLDRCRVRQGSWGQA